MRTAIGSLAFLLILGTATSAQVLHVRAGAPAGGDGSSWSRALPDLGSGGGSIRQFGGSLHVASSAFLHDKRHSVLVDGGGSASLFGTTLFGDQSPALKVSGAHLAVDSCIAWGPSAAQLVLETGGTVAAAYCDVRMNGAGLPGTGNFELDPRFVDAAGDDLHLATDSPCIDAGNPAVLGVAADFERDSRVLDGDLDGTLGMDVGADEHGPLHLEVLGIPAPGGTLTFVTSGPPMLVVLYAGRPGGRFVPRAGTLFLNTTSGLQRVVWPGPPSAVPVPVPASLAGLLLVQQLGAAGGGAFVLSNYVPLQF